MNNQHSRLHSPYLSLNTLETWDQSDPPPVTLKQLSQNLNFLEQQYHVKARTKHNTMLLRDQVKLATLETVKPHKRDSS